MHMDVFNGDAFSSVSLTDALERQPYVPQRLGQMNLFESKPVRTRFVSIEERNGLLALIPTSERGAPPYELLPARRNIRPFQTVRLAKGDTIMAEEVQSIRAFGSESELQQVQAEVALRLEQLRTDMELTKENMRLGALQGILLDADGSTLVNYFTEWGIAVPTEIDFDLDNPSPGSGAVKQKCTQVIRAMQVAAAGSWTPATRVHALCGNTFYDQLTSHTEVRETYLNWTAAAQLRSDNMPFEQFNYGNITFENYRGTDDGSTVSVAATKCKFFPVNARGVFQTAWSPGEWMDVVNTLGREQYVVQFPDRDRNAWVRVELYSYPLYIVTRPGMLQSARNT
jgi:Phage major capsid protein E